MKLFKTKDHAVIKLLAERIKKTMESENQIEKFKPFIKWLRFNINSNYVCIWVALEDIEEGKEEKVIGYCIGNIQQLLDSEHFNIIVFEGDTEEVEQKLFKLVEEWTKDFQITTFGTSTKNKEKWEKLGLVFDEYKMISKMGV